MPRLEPDQDLASRRAARAGNTVRWTHSGYTLPVLVRMFRTSVATARRKTAQAKIMA